MNFWEAVRPEVPIWSLLADTVGGLRLIYVCLAALAPVLVIGQQRTISPTDRGIHGLWFRSSYNAPAIEDESEEFSTRGVIGAPSPTPVLSLSSILGMSSYRAFTSVQVNVGSTGKNIAGDAANEPSMTVDPTNGNRLAVGWRQFDSVTSDFRQGGFTSSSDGGRSWRPQGNLERGIFRSDPVLGSTAEGKFYYLSLQNTFFDDIFPSSDGGIRWAPYFSATGGDKQWMTVDQTTGVGRGHVYQAWSTAGNNYNGRQFSRSTDAGRSWMDPINIPSSPIWGVLDVAKNGDLYIGGLSNPYSFVKSTTAKVKGGTPTFEPAVPMDLGGSIVYSSYINPVGLAGQLWLACDKSSGPHAGNIYMLASVGVNNENPCDVNFVRSTDGGKTWSSPKRINDDRRGVGAYHWFGTLSVAPNGRLDACWNDTRANPGSAVSALYFSSSFDGGATWTKNQQISQSFDPKIGYPVQQKMGDYIAMISDNMGAKIAYTATFNGEEDIWFLRVPAGAVTSSSATSISVFQGSYAGGGLADVWALDQRFYDVNSVTVRSVGQLAAVEAQFKLPAGDYSRLEIRIAGAAATTTTGFTWLYNNATKVWDSLPSITIGSSGLFDANVLGNSPVKPYIAADGKVRALFRVLNPAPKPGAAPVRMRTDLFELKYG